MRYVTVPAPIHGVAKDAKGEPVPYVFASFLSEFVWPDAGWRASNDAVGRLLAMAAKFEVAAPGAVVELESAEWEPLEAAAREAHARFHPSNIVKLMAFVFAISNASPTKPA